MQPDHSAVAAEDLRDAFRPCPKRLVNAVQFHEHFVADIHCSIEAVALGLQFLDVRFSDRCHDYFNSLPLLISQLNKRRLEMSFHLWPA